MDHERPEFSIEGPDDLICRQVLGVAVKQIMYACSFQMKDQELIVYEGSDDQVGQVNSSGSCSADLTGYFGHFNFKCSL